MKLLTYIILSLVLLLNISGCTEKTIKIRSFQSYIDCPCPNKPQFSPIPKDNHIGSVETQEEITKRLNLVVDYDNGMEACNKCFKSQVKNEQAK